MDISKVIVIWLCSSGVLDDECHMKFHDTPREIPFAISFCLLLAHLLARIYDLRRKHEEDEFILEVFPSKHQLSSYMQRYPYMSATQVVMP